MRGKEKAKGRGKRYLSPRNKELPLGRKETVIDYKQMGVYTRKNGKPVLGLVGLFL